MRYVLLLSLLSAPSWLPAATPASPAASADAIAPLGTYSPGQRSHWAFQKRANPKVPEFTAEAERAWANGPVDAFILAGLKEKGLQPSPPADRASLIRRLYFGLTGLPPTPEEVAAFVADKSPDAYSKLVERTLASPHYGERWGQHWLDVVRFAESEGFEYDNHWSGAWRYRDYVVRAFNNDKPYDRFLMEQLAGDEIEPDEQEARVAAGFNRLAPVRRNAGNQDVASSRNEVLTEMTNVVGAAVLGVTLGCARCHDHLFDPILQSDYYRIQAYFAAVQEADVPVATAEEAAAWKAKAEPINKEIADLRQESRRLRGKPEARDRVQEIRDRLEALRDELPAPLPSLHSVVNKKEEKTPIHVLNRGNWDQKINRVGMRPLGVLLPEGAPELPEDTATPRAELAKWIIDPDHPLTARVMVNRIWHYHFGKGIVATPNDFGNMGFRPTHPELLDYLANEFVESGFSVKHVQWLILNSNTYLQSSAGPSDAAMLALAHEKDPENDLLWKFSRRRLEAEEVRDAMLAVSGTLNDQTGGPSVMIPIYEELVNALYKPSQWEVTPDPAQHHRRSIYLMKKRNLPLPFMETFDQPQALVSCAKRESSTHAPQALALLNGSLANEQAEALAARLRREAGAEPQKQIALAYRLATGRDPQPEEIRMSLEFLQQDGSLKELALAVFNLNAFLYVN